MASLNVVRVKRKADEEPVETLVIALKRLKPDDESNEVYLKLATTLTNVDDFDKDLVQNVISRDKVKKIHESKSPKHVFSNSSYSKRMQVLKEERDSKRQQVLADRRLILSKEDNSDDQIEHSNDASSDLGQVRAVFKLYDIIEENEELKTSEQEDGKQTSQSTIECNGVPLIRMNSSRDDTINYVYDVYYVTNGNLDQRFVDGSVSIQPCESNEELVYDSDEPEEYYDDEDDSNDEFNWRNDYPDEDSDFEKDIDRYEYSESLDSDDSEMLDRFRKFAINEEKLGMRYARYKANIMQEMEDGDL